MKYSFLLLTAGLAMTGCKGESFEEVSTEAPPKRVIEFKGLVDDRFVGRWKSNTQDVTYDFQKSGEYTYKGTVQTQGGPQTIDQKGKWLVNSDKLIVMDDKDETFDFTFKLDGTSLSLKTNGQRKIESLYTRLK
jgi:hypothetical protein